MLYEKRIVAFLDILGFKNVIENETTKKESQEFEIVKYTNLIEILEDDFCIGQNKTLKQIKRKDTYFKNTQVTLFSDSVVISKLYDENSIDNQLDCLLRDLYNVIYNSYALGFSIRGGIACGDMIHTDKYMFGPAFNKAYSLEQKAIYPRVIIEDEFAHLLYNTINNQRLLRFIPEDYDGYYYLDPFFGLTKRFKDKNSINYFICNARIIIDKGLSNTNPDIVHKYLWLQKHLDSFEKAYKIANWDFSDI